MTYRYINNPTYQEQNVELRSLYDKHLNRQFNRRIPVHVFGSGSEGNSVYLKPYHTLIDLGLSYKSYMDYSPTFFLDVDYIMLTHHHGDHLMPSTLTRIIKNYPHIKIILPKFMYDVITSDDYQTEYIKREKGEAIPFGHDTTYKTDNAGRKLKKGAPYKDIFLKHQNKFHTAMPSTLTTHDNKKFYFDPLSTKHGDIVNMAIQISDPDLDFEFLYASDLDNLDGERAFTDCYGNMQHVTGLKQDKQYTCIFLEANYDEAILQEYYDKLNPLDPDYRGKKVRADGNLRHISEQETALYIQKYLTEDGLFIPLHASKTFGTLHQG